MGMKAAIFEEKNRVIIKDVEVPAPGPDEILLSVVSAGLCGTDYHIFKGDSAVSSPLIMGHEIAGRVVDIGEDVSGWQQGQAVAVDPNIYCGHCSFCRQGRVNLCENLQAVGVTRDGGFAEYTVVPADNLYPLAGDIDIVMASLVEPLACCLHGIELLNIEPGSRVLILGGGPIGLILAQLTKLRGAGRVVISEPVAAKRELAGELDLKETVAPDELTAYTRQEIPQGFDIVIEAAGRAETVARSFDLVCRGGSILLFGVCPEKLEVPLSPYKIFKNELTVKGSYINPFVSKKAVNILEKNMIGLQPLISERISLQELPGVLAGKASTAKMKTVVLPGE